MDGRDTAGDVPSIESNHSITLDLPPSCIEFSPLHPHYFLVGTYYLKPELDASHTTSTEQKLDQIRQQKQDRRGSLMLFTLNDERL